MGSTDDRAVQRGRRDAGQAVRPPAPRRTRRTGDRAARVRDIGVVTAHVRQHAVHRAEPARLDGHRGGLRGRRRLLVIHGAFQLGTLVALTALLARLYGPITALSNVQVDVMTALVSFDRVFEVLDLQPLIAERPGRGAAARRRAGGRAAPSSSTTCRSATRAASEVSLASLESIALPVPERDGASQRVLRDVSFTAPPGQADRAGRAVRRGQDHDHPPGVPALRPRPGTVRIGGAATCATSRWSRCTTRSAW